MASHAATSPDTPGDEQEKRNNPDIEMTERTALSPDAAIAENNAGSSGEANTAHAATSAQAQTHSDTRPFRSRLDSTAIGPSIPVDEPVASLATSPSANPGLQVTLLLSQQGTKFTYKIDSRYLERRGVVLEETDEEGRKDPLSVSIYTVKELLLREWREEEWGAKPQSPTSIRMIYFGRMLGDKDLLRDCRFNLSTNNIVHLTIRPQDLVDADEEEQKRIADGRPRDRSEERRSPRCCIIL